MAFGSFISGTSMRQPSNRKDLGAAYAGGGAAPPGGRNVRSPEVDPTTGAQTEAWQSANTKALNAYSARYAAAKASGASNPYATATTGPEADATNQNVLERQNLDKAGMPNAQVTGLGPNALRRKQMATRGAGFGMFQGLI